MKLFHKFTKNSNFHKRYLNFIHKQFTTEKNNPYKEKINLTFIYSNDNKEVQCIAEEGQTILELAHKYDVDLEGACDSSLACSTCHVILEENIYNKLEEAKEEEEDLLDLAYGLTSTSRLGCQIKINKMFEGSKIYIPKATRNMYVDGHKPAKH